MNIQHWRDAEHVTFWRLSYSYQKLASIQEYPNLDQKHDKCQLQSNLQHDGKCEETRRISDVTIVQYIMCSLQTSALHFRNARSHNNWNVFILSSGKNKHQSRVVVFFFFGGGGEQNMEDYSYLTTSFMSAPNTPNLLIVLRRIVLSGVV